MNKDQKFQRILELAKMADALTVTQAKEFIDLLVTANKKQKDELVKQFNSFSDNVSQETHQKITEAIQVVSEKHKDALLEVRQLTNKQKKAHEDAMLECLSLLEEVKAIEVKDGVDGKDGIDGKDGVDGKDGSSDSPEEVVEKINNSEKKIKKEKIEGLEDIERIAKGNTGGGITTPFVNGKRAKNITFPTAVISGTGDNTVVTIITVSNTAPSNPQLNQLWYDIS